MAGPVSAQIGPSRTATYPRIAAEARRAALLREENHFAAGRLPSGTTAEQERLVLAAIAGEIVATDPPA